jgi:CO/xanthine dehydrogenase Mo-binding subunit
LDTETKDMTAKSALGQGIPRVEGLSKVTGSCLYAADIIRPEALWGGFLRSPLSHARIVNIDVSRARKLPGVKAVITGNAVLILPICLRPRCSLPLAGFSA